MKRPGEKGAENQQCCHSEDDRGPAVEHGRGSLGFDLGAANGPRVSEGLPKPIWDNQGGAQYDNRANEQDDYIRGRVSWSTHGRTYFTHTACSSFRLRCR